MIDKETLFGAIARGWCTPGNAGKVMDEALIYAIADEVQTLLATTSTEASASPVPRAQGGNTCDKIGGSSPADAGGLTPERIEQIYTDALNKHDTTKAVILGMGFAIEREVLAKVGASPAPSAKQEPSELTDEQIDNALESARERIVEGFGYKYNEADLFAAIRSLVAVSSHGGEASSDFHSCLVKLVRRRNASSPAAAVAAPAPAPVAGSQHVPGQFTEKQIATAARFMSDSSAAVCCVDKDDNWKLYGDSFADEFKGALAAALAAAPAVPVPADQDVAPDRITLNGHQLVEALDAAWPDRDDADQGDTELTFFVRKVAAVGSDGDPLPVGTYFYWTELPEEGAVHLEENPAAPSLQQPKTGSQP